MALAEFFKENGEILEQLALYAYLKEDESKELYESIVGCRLFSQLWTKMFGQDETDKHRAEAILAISNYIKTHPDATQDQIKQEIIKEIRIFTQKIQ